jgi:hypothetical protein
MCKFSPTCRKDCTDALACPSVTAAFGPDVVHANKERAGRCARAVSGWWSKGDGRRPVIRLSEDGIPLCSNPECNEPRKENGNLCVEHYREYFRDYQRRNKAERLSKLRANAKAHYQAHRAEILEKRKARYQAVGR